MDRLRRILAIAGCAWIASGCAAGSLPGSLPAHRESAAAFGGSAATPGAASLPPSALPSASPSAEERGPVSVRQSIARVARAMQGAPYRYGGSDPQGFDCSGLVVYTYGEVGIRGLPRTARGLHARAKRIGLGELLPGDLLFFTFGARRVSHVAIYVGQRSFVHAPKTGGRVERVSFDHPYWSRELGLAGRLIAP